MRKLENLKKSYRPLNKKKLDTRLEFLHRMAVFYNEHLEESNPAQASLFRSFIVSILYAETIIKKYDELTKEIDELCD